MAGLFGRQGSATIDGLPVGDWVLSVAPASPEWRRTFYREARFEGTLYGLPTPDATTKYRGTVAIGTGRRITFEADVAVGPVRADGSRRVWTFPSDEAAFTCTVWAALRDHGGGDGR